MKKDDNSKAKKKNEESKKIKNKNSYDYESKQILSRKDVMSYILRYFVPEYKDIDIKDIKASLESGDDEKHIKLLDKADTSIHNQRINYDIFFITKVPNTNEEISLYINVEPQGNYNEKYKLIRRAIYYVSRLISRQKGEEFNGQDYGSIKKVYSIWLIINDKQDKNKSGCINSYTLNEKQLSGNYKEPKQDYDLFNIIFAYVSNNKTSEYSYIMKLLYTIFIDTNISKEDKIDIYKNEYDNIEVDKELIEMSTFGEAIIRVRQHDAEQRMIAEIEQRLTSEIEQKLTSEIEQRLTSEIEQRLTSEIEQKLTSKIEQKVGQSKYQEGLLNAAVDNVLKLSNNANLSINDALSLLEISDDIKDKVIEEVKKKLN